MQNNDYLKTLSMNSNAQKEGLKTTRRKSADLSSRFSLMFLMAVVLLFTGFLALQPLPVEARGRHRTAVSPDQVMERLKERLDLTEAQEEAIRPIMEEKVQKRKELMERSGVDREAFRTEMQKLRESTDMKLGEILTDEQKGKYLQLKEERRSWMHSGKRHGIWMHGGAKRSPEQVVSRLRERLGLNDEQVAEIQPIIKESIEQRREIFNNYKEKKSEIKLSMRDDMKALSDRTDDRLSKILTDEQKEKFRILRKERHEHMHKHMHFPGAGGYKEQ